MPLLPRAVPRRVEGVILAGVRSFPAGDTARPWQGVPPGSGAGRFRAHAVSSDARRARNGPPGGVSPRGACDRHTDPVPSPDSDGPTAASEPGRKELSRRAFFLGAAGGGVAAGGIASTAILLTRGAAQQPMPTPTPTASPVTVAALLAERPFRVAHRGGSDDWPEMSLYAYQQSIAHGYQALEMSVARSADGVWFGLHDATLDRTSGTIGFTAADHFWSEISTRRISAKGTHDPGQPAQPYLQLRRFLTEFGRDFVLFVDPKAADPSFYPELLDLIHATVPAATRHV